MRWKSGPYLSLSAIHSYLLLTLLAGLALLERVVISDEVRSAYESRKQYPKYGGRPLDERQAIGGDLNGDIRADRPLMLRDLDYLLGLADYLIDKRNDQIQREIAARELGLFGHVYGFPALVAVLRDERDPPDLRMRCAWALTMIRDDRAVEYLVDDGLGGGTIDLMDLVQFAGRPPELADVSWYAGVRPPPKDPDEREEYLQVWRSWWRANRERVHLNRKNRTKS